MGTLARYLSHRTRPAGVRAPCPGHRVDAEIADLPRGMNTISPMKLNDTARQLLGSNPATLVTINRDGSSQVSVVWIVVQRTADGDDELVTAHLADYLKLRNIRRDPRVSVTVVSTDRSGPFTPWLSIKGTARVEEGGAPELLDELVTPMFGPGTGFPPPDAPPGYLTRIRLEKVGGAGIESHSVDGRNDDEVDRAAFPWAT